MTEGQRKGNEGNPEHFFGYKQHASLNAASGMVTSLEHAAMPLPAMPMTAISSWTYRHDLKLGLPISIVTADKGTMMARIAISTDKKIHSAICLDDYRTEEGWQQTTMDRT